MMTPAPLPNEKKRLEVLWDYDVLDTPPEEALDEITTLAALICEAPVALITLLDGRRQWFKSRVGLSVAETARDISFCGHAIQQSGLFVVNDASKDARFADNPLVTAEPHIRFYAGAPLATREGHALGTLCVIDRVPRQLRPEQEQALRVLSHQVMAQFELRRQTREMDAVRLEREGLRRTREALQDQERALVEWHEATQRAAHLGNWELDIPRAAFQWSEEVFHIFGQSIDGFQPTVPSFLEAVHAEDGARVRAALNDSLANGVPFNVDHRIVRPDGESRFVSVQGDVVLGGDGRPFRMVGTLRDTTELRKAEHALNRSQSLFRLMIENAQDMLSIVDAGGGMRFQSPAVLPTLGYTPEALTGRNIAEFIHPQDLPSAMSSLGAAFAGPERAPSAVFRFRHADGSWHTIEAVGRVMQGEDTPMVIVNSRDITERRQAEDQHRRGEERLKLALAGSRMGVWEWDVRADAVSWSPEFHEILGVETESVTFDESMRLVHPDDAARVRTLAREALANRTLYSVEFRIIRPDGQARWLSALGTGTYGGHGEPLCLAGIVQDITERKLASSIIAGQNRVLERIATGASLQGVLEEIVRTVEEQIPSALCSVLLLDRDNQHLHVAAAPSLPAEYNAAIEGESIGPDVGAVGDVGTALFRRETVIVTDIATDPHWAGRQKLALAHGLRSCWSVPVYSLRRGDAGRQEVLGAFAVYFRETRAPDPESERVIARAAHLARVAIERDHAAQALRESEERLRLAAEVAQMGTWDRNLRNNTLYWSPGMERLMGFEPGTFPGTYDAFCDLIHPDDRAAFDAAQNRAFTGDAVYQVELRFKLRDGRVRWGFVRGKVMFNAAGQAERIVGVDLDITERKRAREELQRFISLSPAVLYAMSARENEFHLSWVSDNVVRLTGYAPDEMLRENRWLQHVHPDDQTRLVRGQEALHAAGQQTLDYRFRRADGKYVWIQDERRLLRDARGEPSEIVGAWSNASERVQLQEQYRQAQKMEAIGQLAGGVAHDFNNILTIIHGNASLLLDPAMSPEDDADAVRQIVQAAERAAGLTRQLLLFGRKQVMRPTDIDLNEVVGNMTRMLQRILGEDVLLRAEFAPELPLIHADTGMIEQVLLNLAVNSRDAMPGGGRLTIATSVKELRAEDLRSNPEAAIGRMVHLAVTDTGSGIPPEVLPRIFEPFYTTKEVGKGTGLGLATVYGIVQQHRGEISVASEVGNGTTFHIYLPAVAGMKVDTGTRPRAASLPRGTETILVVEDEVAVRLLVTDLLQRCGYKIFSAPSGAAALEVWNEHRDKIQLLLTDMVMPDGMSGRQLADALRVERPDLKVIYTSGYSPEATGQGKDLPPNTRFLQKPFDPFRLTGTIRTLLDQR